MWRRLWIAWACIIALVFAAGAASAASGAPEKPHQGTSEFSAALNVCAFASATVQVHTGKASLPTSLTSDVPDAARGVTALSKVGQAKIPSSWGRAAAAKKGVGVRWTDPTNKGNGVRIDAGNPANSQITQQVDHVIVRHNGRVIGRNGKPITGSIADNAAEAHIPLSEWQTWSKWFAP